MSDPYDSDPVANNQDQMNLNQSMNSQTNPMGDSMNMGNSNFSFHKISCWGKNLMGFFPESPKFNFRLPKFFSSDESDDDEHDDVKHDEHVHE